MGGKFLKILAAGAAAATITIGVIGAATPAAAGVWVHGGGGWHGGGWHGGWGGWRGGYGGWGWRGGYGGWGWRGGGWGWRTGWYGGGWGWRGGYGWGVPAVAVGVGVPAYYPNAYPAYAPGNPRCWQVRAVYSQAGVYLGNRSVNVCH